MAHCTYDIEQHPQTDWRVVRLTCDDDGAARRTIARFVPEMGSNLIGLEVTGPDGRPIEYLMDLDPMDGSILGTPILYPTPNRVRDAYFNFEGQEFRFEPNNGPHFIHGLVREIPWSYEEPCPSAHGISVRTYYTTSPDTEAYARLPIRNTLELVYTLSPGSLRLDFLVRNEDTEQRLPFGLAIHPYFRVLGPRSSVRLRVPAQKWMEAVDLLPTGRLVNLSEGPADLREPTPLEVLDLDDVFWGLTPSQPQVIYYDEIGTQLTLVASEAFTHSVVYTPAGRPFFCVENQTCSTDAHNLHTRGLQKAAHLLILEPGETLAASVVFHVGGQRV